MTTAVHSDLELARAEFNEWRNKQGSELGKGEYEQVAAKVKHLTQGLLTKDMTLHFQYFRFSFQSYYGEKLGGRKFVPISWEDGLILKWQAKKETGGSWWPIKDPETYTYFIPKITLNTPTDQYLHQLITCATDNRDSREFRILEALTPYAKEIKSCCGDLLYRKITNLVPGYPAENW